MGFHTLINKSKYGLLSLMILALYSVRMYAAPVASFTATPAIGCVPLNVQFNNTSTGATSYFWTLGNGNTSTLANPSNLYTNTGNYTIRLIAYDAAGNSDTATYSNYVQVNGKPTASFYSVNLASCLDNNSFSFINTTTGGSTYLWDFGDGTTSTQSNPTHSYQQSGTFTVTLLATNAYGCQDIKIQNQYITIYPKPNAIITAPFTSGCDTNTPFQFSNNGPGTTSWTWNFGDGTGGSGPSVTHVYSNPGGYDVSLIVVNSFGCRDTSDSPTRVIAGSTNWGTFTTSTDSGCAPLSVNFTNTSWNVASTYWMFGDGNTSSLFAPTHVYNLPGVYTVTMIVTTTSGCVDTVRMVNKIKAGLKPSPSFTYTNGVGCGPLTVQFTNTSSNFTSCLWVFGDGTTSTDINPIHTYISAGTFSVTLKCWGPSGCTKSTVYQNIIKVTRTKAMFSASPRVGCPPLNVNFGNLSMNPGLTYFWSFGDGATSTAANPSHTYTTSGVFDVMLIVRDSLGCADTLRKPAFIQTVNPAANYVPPPTTVGCAPLTTQFTDGTLGATSWLWNFGDGTTSTLQNPLHSYTTPGFYTVSLTTTSAGGGCVQTISNFSSFDVRGGYAGFTHNVSACPPYIGTFVDSSLNAVSWLWDFGDGTTSTDQNPSHTFNSPGYHSVSLTITTADGCSYTTMQSNSVYFNPFGANFYGIPLDTVFPMPVQWHANSVGATGWLWDFGDGTTSTLENPFHIYQLYGNYNVTLTITNGTCTLFYDPPPFNFGMPDTTPVNTGNPGEIVVQQGCLPLSVTFTKRIPGSNSWDWDFGDGGTSNLEFPIHTYARPGIYTVQLTTTDTLGIVQVFRMDSIVRVSGPVAGFIITQSASCNNTQISITDTSSNAVRWNWSFGDSTTSTLQHPVHVYNSGLPNYIITQTVTDTMGCTSSLSSSIFSSFISPLLVSESEICGYDTVHFYTSLQNYSSYLWDFGDGTTSSLPRPSHLYAQEGVFNVSLTVVDQAGCSQSFQLNPPITVNLPVASFISTGRQGCNKLNVLFTNQSQNADAYLWTFGDGTSSSLPSPIHQYFDAGKFDVSLTVFRGNCISTDVRPNYISVDTAFADYSWTTSGNCMPINVQFTDLSVNPVSWRWEFGDGDSATVQHPSHLYLARPQAYPRLIMTDVNGCKDTVSYKPFTVLIADFLPSQDSGCVPTTIHFQDRSNLATNWFWDFGDGTTSTLQSPTHTYSQPGDYDITLIVRSIWANCSDTLRMPAKIKIKEPKADFVSFDRYACAPSLVNFTDLSVDADSYLWDFGDSTTSTNAVPSHIYNRPGIYDIKLIVRSNAGCTDTIVKPQYITVLGPQTNFTASAFEGCAPFSVNFTDLSREAVDWTWSFGDGYSNTIQHPTHVFRDTGIFTVSMITRDTAGCSSYYELPQKIIVHPTPEASFSTGNIRGCQPYTANFTNLSSGASSAYWTFGDGGSSTDFHATHEFIQSGNYTIQLIASNNFGCRDTFRLNQPLEILQSPLPSFTSSAQQGCSPFLVNFFNTTLNPSGPTYLWDFGNGNTSTAANPAISFTVPGFYTISLTVTNANGCSNQVVYPNFIQVLDTNPPPISKIYSVSVVSNTEVEITWENNPAIDLASYVLYRLNRFTNNYDVIFTETNPQNSNFSLESSYRDRNLNTLQNTYTYKLQAIDICGNTIPLDQLTAHTTINVSSERYGEDIRVSWTPYEGCPVNTYEIFRCEPGNNFVYLATVSASTFDYIDSTFDCPYPYAYKILGTDLCGTVYTSFSDTSITHPLNVFANQIVDVVRSTVVDNKMVLTEWKEPVVQPEKVAQYDIYRSTDNTNFSYLASVPSVQTDFLDYQVDVQNNHYYYKIQVINTCNILEELSPNTSTVLLKGEMNEARQVFLNWTPYLGWDQGVEYYILEKLDENGRWQLLKQVDGETFHYNYQE